MKIKLIFFDKSNAELFEFVTIAAEGLKLLKYSFHWQDSDGKLLCRWDNAPHHPEILNAPHHKHNSDGTITGVSKPLDIFGVLEEINRILNKVDN